MIRKCTAFWTCIALSATALTGAVLTSWTQASRADDPPGQTVTVTRTVTATYRGRTASGWAKQYRHRTRQLQASSARAKRLHRALLARPSVQEALALACVAYRTSCGRVYWIAWCESTLQPGVENPEPHSDASGLGQFLSSTWRGTPYGRFSVFSPYANALAIAYEVAAGNSYVHWAASAPCWSRRS